MSAERPRERVLLLAREIARTPEPSTGAERRLAAFLAESAAQGAEVLAHTAGQRAHVAAGASSRSAAAVWHRLPLWVRGLRRDLVRLVGAVRFVVRVLPEARRFKPTVVLERAAYLDPSGALLARLLGVPHVVELHGDLAADVRAYYRSPLAPLGRAFERRRYRRADGVVVVSRGLADVLEAQGLPPSRISVIPNGVSAPARPPRPECARARWNVEDRAVVGWIGHLMPWQLDAFDELASGLVDVDRRRPLALVIVAPQSEATAAGLERLRVAAPYPVVLAGEAVGDDADDAVAAFDVGVVPAARAYDLPVKLFHYALLGAATVAPSTRSIRDFDAGRELLYLFEPGAAAAAVEAALADPGRERRVAELGRIVREGHTWAAVTAAVLEACRQAASSSGRSRSTA